MKESSQCQTIAVQLLLLHYSVSRINLQFRRNYFRNVGSPSRHPSLPTLYVVESLLLLHQHAAKRCKIAAASHIILASNMLACFSLLSKAVLSPISSFGVLVSCFLNFCFTNCKNPLCWLWMGYLVLLASLPLFLLPFS